MRNDEAIVDLAGLTLDGVALSDALLIGDLSEARFRAVLIARQASGSALSDVRAAAVEVIRLFGPPRGLPMAGYALAVLELSGTLARTLRVLRLAGPSSRPGLGGHERGGALNSPSCTNVKAAWTHREIALGIVKSCPSSGRCLALHILFGSDGRCQMKLAGADEAPPLCSPDPIEHRPPVRAEHMTMVNVCLHARGAMHDSV
jgi:hypothetical protein